MLDVCVSRKNKINLSDYDYRVDIENRLLMSTFTTQDVEVLEEILFGSIRIPLVKLRKNLGPDERTLMAILTKLSKTGLFIFDGDAIVVDKDMRKYYEYQILKFDDDFKPNMSYLQGVLRKIPIHVLPVWYSIPRSTNNIFASMIEKYFCTPQVYERYLAELNLIDPVMAGIGTGLVKASDYILRSEEVRKKYDLTQEALEEYLLHLELNFVCCPSYRQNGERWEEVITPFHEWAEYLRFKKRNIPETVSGKIDRIGENEKFSFIKDMTALLEEMIDRPLSLQSCASDQDILFPKDIVSRLADSGIFSRKQAVDPLYFSRLAGRLMTIGMVIRHEETLSLHPRAPGWLNMELEDKALYLYRHPDNRTLRMGFNPELDSEKNVREVEKGLDRAADKGWVCLDTFLKGMTCSIGNNEPVFLCKDGNQWLYKLPSYNDEELQFMRYVIMQRLYEVGMTDVVTHENKDYFRLLPFGRDTLC